MKRYQNYIQEDCFMGICKEKLEVGSEFKVMFINLDFELSLEDNEKYMICTFVDVRKDEVVFMLNCMGMYLENEIEDMILNYWPEKKVIFKFDNRVVLPFETFKVFCETHPLPDYYDYY